MKLLLFLLLPCLALSEVGTDFSQCKEFFLNNVPPQFTLDSTAHICQCLKDDNGQKRYFYATLYSTAWRIPVYSAYVFGSAHIGREDAWYIEPQLDGGNTADPCMGPQEQSNPDIGNNQAVNSDYEDSGYNKGHLYPVQHTGSHLSMLATSTLTNAAPQDRKFNQKEWNKHEEDVIADLKNCDTAYVVTGVVPDTNKKMYKRVTVSEYYWRATCCQKKGKFKGQGYYGPDKGKVKSLSIKKLQEKLAKDYRVNILIFPGVPPRDKRFWDSACY